MPSTSISACLALALSPALQEAPAPPQERALASFQEYLARRPYDERAFELLVERLRPAGELERWLASYSEAAAARPDEVAARVVLARLHAARGDPERALAVLAADPAVAGARALRLRATWLLELGERDAAIELLGRAAEEATDPDLLADLLERRAAAQLAAGDRDGARASLERLGELAGDDWSGRMDAGERLARAGFAASAARQYDHAAWLAENDLARRSRAAAAAGREMERAGDVEEAITLYLQAVGALAPDHWLAKDLRGRLLDLHEREGRLEELAERYLGGGVCLPIDPVSALCLAEVEERAGDPRQGLATLADAIEESGGHEFLARARIDMARRCGAPEVAIDELQRWLARRPDAVDLRLELGDVLADDGRIAGAEEQWRLALETRPRDASLVRCVAERWRARGENQRARALVERAIGLEPAEVEHVAALAELLAATGEVPAAVQVLDGARERLGASPGALERLARLYDDLGLGDEAVATLAGAARRAPEDARLRLRLAELLNDQGRRAEAARAYRDVVDGAADWDLRIAAAERHARAEGSPQTGAGESALLLEVARSWSAGERGAADAAFAELLALAPDAADVREWHASWLAESGRPELALDVYGELARLAPRRARAYLSARAALYERLGRADDAVACVERIVRELPDDAAARLELGRLHASSGGVEAARRHLVGAWERGDDAQRAEATTLLHALLAAAGPHALDEELAALDLRLAASPFDTDLALLAADLARRAGRTRDALERVHRAMSLRPREPRLLRLGLELLLDAGDTEQAIEVAARLATVLAEPIDAVALFEARGLVEPTRALLERLASESHPHRDVLRELARRYVEADLPAAAIAVLERMRQCGWGDWRTTSCAGRLHGAAGDRPAALAEGRRLFAEAPELARVREYFEAAGLRDEYAAELGAYLCANVEWEERVRAAVRSLAAAADAALLDAVRRMRAETLRTGRRPAGHTRASWSRWLSGVAIVLEAQARAQAWTGRQLRELTETRWTELLWIAALAGSELPAEAAPALAAERFPRSPLVLTAAGRCLETRGEHARAADVYRRLEALLDEPQNEREASLARERAWARHAAEGRAAHAPLALVPEAFERALALTFDPGRREPWELELVWSRETVRRHRALCLARAGRLREARELLVDPDDTTDSVYVLLDRAAARLEAGLVEEAAAGLAAASALLEGVRRDPSLAGGAAEAAIEGRVHAALDAWARAGAVPLAYDVLRSRGDVDLARALLRRSRGFLPVCAEYRRQLRRAREAWESAQDAEDRARLARELHETAAKLAEVHWEAGQRTAARNVWRDLPVPRVRSRRADR